MPSIVIQEANVADSKESDSEKWTTESLQRLLADAITYQLPLNDLDLILKGGAEVNGKVSKGLRPLHYAAFVNSKEFVSFLIQNGADVNLNRRYRLHASTYLRKKGLP